MREITTHRGKGLNEAIRIAVLDEPGAGHACHVYQLELVPTAAGLVKPQRGIIANCYILFQNGPIADAGVNGISNEALLAIIRDRLEGFQSGPYASHANANALEDVIQAMQWLRLRTESHVIQGVEGINQQ